MNRTILLQCQSEDVKREEKVQEQLPLLPAPLKRFEGWRWKQDVEELRWKNHLRVVWIDVHPEWDRIIKKRSKREQKKGTSIGSRRSQAGNSFLSTQTVLTLHLFKMANPFKFDLNSSTTKQFQSLVQSRLVQLKWSEQGDDLLSEYCVVLLANNKPSEQILTELSEIVGSQLDPEFVKWLVEKGELFKKGEIDWDIGEFYKQRWSFSLTSIVGRQMLSDGKAG